MKKSELLQIIREEVGKALEDTCVTACEPKCIAVVKQELDDYNMKCRLITQDPKSSACYLPCFSNCKKKCESIDAKKRAEKKQKEAEASKKKGPIASAPPKKVKPKLVPRKEDHCYKHSQCKCKNCYCDMSDTELVKDKYGKARPHGRCASKNINTVDFD